MSKDMLKDISYKTYVLDTIAEYCPFKKKSKFAYSHYYDIFLYVLKNVNLWNDLSLLSSYKSNTKYHCAAIRKMFNKNIVICIAI